MKVSEAIKERFSVRAYLDKPVSKETVYKLLDLVRFAPSGHNTQPWEVAVLTGKTKENISNKLIEAVNNRVERKYDFAYGYKDVPDFVKARRNACNVKVFNHKNIDPKKDKDKLKEHILENFRFFGAPVGLILMRDKRLGEEAFVDIGIFAQTLMLAALEFGLATCSQTSVAAYAELLHKELDIPDEKMIVMSMALGYPDMEAHINKLRMDREEVDAFTTFYE